MGVGKMKKVLSIVAILLVAVGIIGCGGKASQTKNEAKADFPTKPITLIVSFAAGGGTDVGARILAPYLEKELGVPVIVDNRPGAGGWVGYSELLKAKPDGYTLGYLNTPGLITGYLNPATKRQQNLDSFAYVANHVLDPGVIAVRADETRFTTIQELIEYAKKNELTSTTNGVGTGPHMMALDINKKLGTKFKPVHFNGTGEYFAAVLGGHIDVYMARVGESLEPVKDKQLKVLAVTTKERVPQYPEVPTLREIGGDVINYTSRGIAVPKGIDPKVLEKLQAAMEKAVKNPEHVKKMEAMGLTIDGRSGAAYKGLLQEEEKTTIELKPLLGW